LVTAEIELSAIAAPAIVGFNKKPLNGYKIHATKASLFYFRSAQKIITTLATLI